jgi:hypothetical protein
MSSILNSGLGEPQPADQQAAALDRLKLMLSQLPNITGYEFNPPDEDSPVNIDLVARRYQAQKQQLADRLDMVSTAYTAAKALGVAVPPSMNAAISSILESIVQLQFNLPLRPPGQ